MTVTRRPALCDIGHFGASAEIPPQPPSCWCGVNCSFALMAGRAGNSAGLVAYLERVAMRNALGLMLASVVAAVVIAGVWYLDLLAARRRGRPQDNCRPCRRSAAGSRRQACRQGRRRDHGRRWQARCRAAAARSPAVPQKPACANPDALGVSRVVEIDTTGGPGFGFEHFKQFDFLEPTRKSC